jgi:hypothetical protein
LDLQHFGNDENWLVFLVGGQPYDFGFGLSEDMEVFNVGGRHLGIHGIQHGIYEDAEEYKLDDFWMSTVV